MNSRTIKKILMKHRRGTFWGRRALITVRFPLSMLPPPPCEYPRPEGEGWTEFSVGHFMRESPEGLYENWSISQVSGTYNPLTESEGDLVHPEFVTLGESWTDKEGVEHTSCEWWEGTLLTILGEERMGVILPKELIEQHIARYNWEQKYFHGAEGETGIPVMDALLRVYNHAATFYLTFSKGSVYMTFSVKTCYRRRLLRFCSALSKALRVAEQEGIPLKIRRKS